MSAFALPQTMSVLRKYDFPLYLTGAAAVCSPISIAGFELLMGAAILAMIVERRRWRVPPMWLPLSLFVLGTLISLAANGHFEQGLPQIKKFYVYSLLFLVTSSFREIRQIRALAIGWALSATLSAAWGLNQFYNKYEDAMESHQDFYLAYVADRITGFAHHWMTFSGQMMMVLLVIASFIFFGKSRPWTVWLLAGSAVISVALIAAETRSVWLATAVGAAYLIWFWKRWALIALPVLVAIIMLINPFEIGDRVRSAIHPNGDLDSNAHRKMCRMIGYQMIAAHPVFGIGPEQVTWQYLNYLPPGTRLPLPRGYHLHLHNIYVHYAAELGIPAMLAMLWMLLRPLYDFTRALRRSAAGAGERWVLHGAIAVIIAILVEGFYEKNIGDSHVLSMFLAIVGCGYVAVMSLEEKEKCKA